MRGVERPVAIVGTGAAVPDRVVKNAEIARRVEVDEEWIVARTGIRERRAVEVGKEGTTDLAERAARQALEAAEVAPAEIDLIVVGTTTPDYPVFPATAALLAARLGARRAQGFDLSLACTGFIAALVTAEKFVATRAAERALAVGVDCMTTVTDPNDRNTCVIFADGGGATVLRPAREGEGEILWASLGLEGNRDMLYVPAGGALLPASRETVDRRLHFVRMNGRETFKFAVHKLAEGIRDAAAAIGREPKDLDLVIPHQVNSRIIDAAVERVGFPAEKVAINVDRYGNTSGGSVPIALDEAVRGGRIKRGDHVALVGFGAGLAWGSVLVRW
jgi:3-oxoacyl-[acyl-carrier-protein] synthase-3